jgi:DNA-binding LytR/AlgR family response regulator
MYKIAICDDVKSHIEYLKKMLLLSGFKIENTIFDEYLSGEEFIECIETKSTAYDLLILDMQMGQLSGFETAIAFRQHSPNSVVVFCSGTERANERTLEAEPYRYLLKGYTDEQMIHEMKQVFKKVVIEKEQLFISVKCDGQKVGLSIKVITYIEKAKRGCKVYIDKRSDKYKIGKYCTSEEHLDKLIEELDKLHFARAHNSYIVNIKHLNLDKTTKGTLIMNDGTELPISRSKEKMFRDSVAFYMMSKY